MPSRKVDLASRSTHPAETARLRPGFTALLIKTFLEYDDDTVREAGGSGGEGEPRGRRGDLGDECRLDRGGRLPDRGGRRPARAARRAVELLHYHEHPYEPEVRRQVAARPGSGSRAIAELNVRVGELFAEAVPGDPRRPRVWRRSDVDLIGSHGQTVYHHSSIPGARRATLQVGDGDVIAERTGSRSSPTSAPATSRPAARGPRSRPSPT